jgi:SAM-dependent methyltransferase
VSLTGEMLESGSAPESLSSQEIKVLSVESVEVASGQSYTRKHVHVNDPSDPFERAKLNAVMDIWSDAFLDNEENKIEYPIPAKKNDFKENPALDWFYNHPDGPGSMQEWRTLVMTARALHPMQRLNDMERFMPSHTVSERTRNILTNSDDAVGIRSRAKIMESIVKDAAEKFPEQELRMVSLGAGAAVPAINAVLAIKEQLNKNVYMGLYDQDGGILDDAKDLAEEDGVPPDQIETHTGDYTDAYKLPKESVHYAEALGLSEYLHDSRVVRLIQEMYDILKPGGVLVISNMLKDRKQLSFNQRGVAWPGVKPRSEQELIAIVEAAGIPLEQVTFTTSEDGVYGVLEIHKPWA